MMPYAKAVLACLIAFVGVLIAAAADDHISLVEWLTAAGAGLAALGGVYGVPNKPTAMHQPEHAREQ